MTAIIAGCVAALTGKPSPPDMITMAMSWISLHGPPFCRQACWGTAWEASRYRGISPARGSQVIPPASTRAAAAGSALAAESRGLKLEPQSPHAVLAIDPVLFGWSRLPPSALMCWHSIGRRCYLLPSYCRIAARSFAVSGHSALAGDPAARRVTQPVRQLGIARRAVENGWPGRPKPRTPRPRQDAGALIRSPGTWAARSRRVRGKSP